MPALKKSWNGKLPSDFVVRLNVVKSIKDSIALEQMPSIAKSAEDDLNLTGDIVYLLIAKVNKLVNVKDQQKMSDVQTRLCRDLIINDPDLSRLNFADLHVCVNRALSGYYGAIYGSIDSTLIGGWMRKYIEEKKEALMRSKLADEIPQIETNGIPMPEYVRETMKKLANTDRETTYKNHVRRDLTPDEQRAVGILTEFDRLWKEQGYKDNGPFRIIEVDGKIYNQMDYMQYRIEEGGNQ